MDLVFFVALLEIIGINVILSGDNAVVIALACRALPAHQQKTGVILGAGAAVAPRIVFTLFVAWLMAIPLLKLGGGLLLLWVGYKLMAEEEPGEDGIAASGHLLGAIRTIVIADAVMSLDNVLAVAAAAKGDLVLLVLGLIVSIPLVVYGATLMMVLIRRFPFIVTLGAALIGYVAGEVMVSDPLLQPWIEARGHWPHIVAPVACAALVVDRGTFFRPRRVREPGGIAELAGAPAALFGFRALIVLTGELVLTRAPLIVSVTVALLGYAGTETVLPPAEAAAGKTLTHTAGPLLGAGLALLIAEVAGRLLGKPRR